MGFSQAAAVDVSALDQFIDSITLWLLKKNTKGKEVVYQ